uniref:Zinc finger, CCHC-type n=1 Tax=Tanacetum cinerariifolium TaxID=118510 RepID=A0A6L2NBN7_TANCI|nr:zinc finger, CCHC-type [Tanacetum cinerariifolium]
MRTTMVLVLTRNQSWNVGSVARLVTSKGIVVVVKRTTQMLVVRERGLRTNPKTKVDAIAWWIDSGATTYGCKAMVRLLDPKRKTLGEKESRDAIFDENRFSSIPRPKDIIPNVEDPRTYNEAMQSRDAAFWKEAIDDEIGSIMENNTWVLSDLPPGCKPLGFKWIFKRKMKVDGTIDKFKARLVIQGFRQKEGIDYFDTYAPVSCITTIRLLLALEAIHNLVIHQMDGKTAFLNGDLDEEVYMKQPE